MASLVQRPDSPLCYIQWLHGGKLKRASDGPNFLQIAKKKLRQFESARARGDDTCRSRSTWPSGCRRGLDRVAPHFVLPSVRLVTHQVP